MSRTRRGFCPFVDQTELVERMTTDLRLLRGGLRVAVRTENDAAAVEQLDRWITATVADLRGRRVGVPELQQIALEWQRRRARFLGSEIADVIVVES